MKIKIQAFFKMIFYILRYGPCRAQEEAKKENAAKKAIFLAKLETITRTIIGI